MAATAPRGGELKLDPQVLADLAAGRFAFIDAGCAAGGSIDHCERRFGRRPGLGLDWYGADLDVARSRGHAVAACDLKTVELPARCVEFVSALDFLEHLPDEATAEHVLRQLGRAARRFLYIRHPSFEDVDYLARHGLKLGWTDWEAHPNGMRMADFRRLFARLGWHDYVIEPDLTFVDSSARPIVPIDAPRDTVNYDPALHGPKPWVEFDRPIHGQYNLFVRLDPGIEETEWRRLVNLDGWRTVWPGDAEAGEMRPPGEVAKLFSPG